MLSTLNAGNTDLSTSEQSDIEKSMQDHLKQGGTHFIMEVTADGVDQAGVSGVDFNIKLQTNVNSDHLDYHKRFEHYQQTKVNFMGEGKAHKIHPQTFRKELIDFSTKLLGQFNLLNIKAAVSVLRHINIAENIIQETVQNFNSKIINFDEGKDAKNAILNELETFQANLKVSLSDISHVSPG